MTGMTILLIVVLILAVVIPLAIAHSRAVNQAWESAARKLGLAYTPARFLQSRRIGGRIDGFAVVVDTYTQSSGKHSKSFTRFRVTYPDSLRLGLRLKREGMFSSVTKLFGAQDVELGDATFDRSMLVKGQDAGKVRAFLTPSRRMRVQRFFASHHSATVDDSSIRWDRHGILSKRDLIVSTVQSMVRLAWHLTGDRQDDERLQAAMQLQNDGRPEDALQAIEAAVQRRERVAIPSETADNGMSTGFLEEPIEERVLQAELQYLSGDRKAARDSFVQLQKDSPDDEEFLEWIDFTSSEAKHPASASTSVTVSEVDAKQFCDRLFADKAKSYEVNRLFEHAYQGREVNWTGELQKVERNYSSFVFEDSGGMKATLKIDERPSPYYGTQNVLAVVHVPDPIGELLKSRVGEEVNFQGTLIKADGLMRNVYLDHGRLPDTNES